MSRGSERFDARADVNVAEYETLQRADEPILAPGHRLTTGQRNRRKAKRLVDDARALQAQAEHQVRRAKRNAPKQQPS